MGGFGVANGFFRLQGPMGGDVKEACLQDSSYSTFPKCRIYILKVCDQ